VSAVDEKVDDEVESSRAPLITHLIELRSRLIKSFIAIGIAFVACFILSDRIYNILVMPYVWAAGTPSRWRWRGTRSIATGFSFNCP